MPFNSNPEMICHYFKELLSDGKEYSMPDIIEYVKQQHGDMGIDGNDLSKAIFESAIRNFLRSDNGEGEYSLVRRGKFQRLAPDPANVVNTVCWNMAMILSKAEQDLRECFGRLIRISEMPDETLFALRDTGKEVFSLLNQATQAVHTLQHSQNKDMNQCLGDGQSEGMKMTM